MTTGEVIGIAMIATAIGFCLFIQWSFDRRYRQLLDLEIRVRQQKRDIVEAIRLIEYGALDEGVELLMTTGLFVDSEAA